MSAKHSAQANAAHPRAGAKLPRSLAGGVMAAETMETKQDLVRLLDGAIAKAKGRKWRKPTVAAAVKKRVRCRNAQGVR